MTDDFLDDFDKFSGFDQSAGFGGAGGGGFDLDVEDEMKFNKNSEPNTDRKKELDDSVSRNFKFSNPLASATDLDDLKFLDNSRQRDTETKLLDFNFGNSREQRPGNNSPDTSNFLQIPSQRTLSPKPIIKPSPAKAVDQKPKVSDLKAKSHIKPVSSKQTPKAALPEAKKPPPTTKSSTIPKQPIPKPPPEPKKASPPPPTATTKPQKPPSTRPPSKTIDDDKARHARPASGVTQRQPGDRLSAAKVSPRKDKGNMPSIVLTQVDMPKLEFDPAISIDDGDCGGMESLGEKSPGKIETQKIAVDKGGNDSLDDFGDFDHDMDAPVKTEVATIRAHNKTKLSTDKKEKAKLATLEEPTDQQFGGFDGDFYNPPPPEEDTKKNKFLNVHERDDDFDDDFGIESNAISDQVGSHVPKVNLDHSEVSNRNLDEKLISTVKSEQLESLKEIKESKIEQTKEKAKINSMEGINEVSGDNSNSQNKTGSHRAKQSEATNHNVSDPIYEEPLNQPTFMDKESQEIKPNNQIKPKAVMQNAFTNIPSKLSTLPSKNPAVGRPQSSTGGSKSKQPNPQDPPPKKARLPDFGLKPQAKLAKVIPIAALLAKVGADTEGETSKDVDFGHLLTALTKHVKRDLKEIEDQGKVKVVKPKNNTEIQRELLEKERMEITKAILGKMKMDEQERRKIEIEEAKQKLAEFQKQNGIKYPKPKQKAKPSLIEKTKVQEPPKDLIAEANNYIRSGAWKNKAKQQESSKEESKDGKKEDPPAGLFQVEEIEQGDNNMPMSQPSWMLNDDNGNEADGPTDEVEDIKSDNVSEENPDFMQQPKDVGLSNLPENNSEAFFQGVPQDMLPDPEPKAKDNQKSSLSKSKGIVIKDKNAVFNQYRAKEAERQRKAEEALMMETYDKKVKQLKKKEAKLEEDFRLAQDLEEKEKRERLDKYSQGHVLIRHTKPADTDGESRPAQPKNKYSEFRFRSGAGVPGLLHVTEEKDEQRDIKFRALEVTKAHEAKLLQKQQEQDKFKDQLNKQKEYLKERTTREQEKLRALREEKTKKHSNKEHKSSAHEKDAAPRFTVEESIQGDQAAFGSDVDVSPREENELQEGAGPRLKMKHSIKLKSYIEKLQQVTSGLLSQIKDRDTEYNNLKKEYDSMATKQMKDSTKERRETIEACLKRIPTGKLFDILRGDSLLIRVAMISRVMRDISELSSDEKKIIRDCLSKSGDELLTFNKFEQLLKEGDSDDDGKVTRSLDEIETEKKLSLFMIDLEVFSDSLADTKASIESRECDSVDAYNSIQKFKKQQLKHLAIIPGMMETLTSRLNNLMSSLDNIDKDQSFLMNFEKLDKGNKDKLDQLNAVYNGALKDFDDVDGKMKSVKLFEIDMFEEIEAKEKDIAKVAFEATNKIHSIEFKQKNDVLNFVAFAGKQKKSALIIQCWFRGWKARKLYRAKRSFKQRMTFLCHRWVLRFRKRAATKMIPELLDSYYRARTHIALSFIRRLDKLPPFDRKLSLLTIRMLTTRSARQGIDYGALANFLVEKNIIGVESLPTEVLDPTLKKDEHEMTETEDSSKQGIFSVDGKSIYFALILQRFFRYFRNKVNPEVFYIDSNTGVKKCNLCMISPIRVVSPDDNICLYCWPCFDELIIKKKRTKTFKLLKSKASNALAITLIELKTLAHHIYCKISKSRDFIQLCRAWDFNNEGRISVEDSKLLVERLKMITQNEKKVFVKYIMSLQGNGMVDYGEIIGSLQPTQ